MSDNKNVSVQIGPGLPALLTLLFVGLKLTGHISWSWLWILSPIWISVGVSLLLFGAIAAIVFAAALMDK
jgi:hypothetical protein